MLKEWFSDFALQCNNSDDYQREGGKAFSLFIKVILGFCVKPFHFLQSIKTARIFKKFELSVCYAI